MNWVQNNGATIWQALSSHLLLALPPVLLSFLLSLPLGWLAYRHPRWRSLLVTGSSLIYAIPSLPLLIVLPALIGTSVRSSVNVVVALTLYGIALMVRSTADALSGVNHDTIISATALGYSTAKRFFRVELPLAGPGLLAGIRVVAVSTMALVTASAVLGIPSLGTLFTDGFQRGIMGEIVTGIIGTALLAVAVDRLLVLLGRLALPWTRSRA
ncbi:ABC transporter permease subunit [Propionimicrobium sp. PCR01-08-3]|uniref:ABC transporter permease n=1 Tax=Propionimicrobium sp. PCR01-08-3 TaxID=3052086 RepID=UPI00255CCDE8|nr:ABC transporter permease subunit [Propionimicrobium sp. PCR01-08-3]WIY81906.1 ABC transporter permease subunit [Propionimicrobium sp. PCR01-08-3]